MESYAAGESTTPLLEETIGHNFERTVAAHADREALVEAASGRHWTWRELDHAVDEVARGLIAFGIEKGDRVGMWAPNCAEWTMTQFATAKIGAVLVNVNPAYRTHEFSFAVNHSGMRLLLAASSFKSSDYRSMIEQTRTDCPTLERTVYLDSDDWPALVAAGREQPADIVDRRSQGLSPDDPINIQYTSGTTGFPRAPPSVTATSSTTATSSPS